MSTGEDLGKKLAGVLGIPTGNITELTIKCQVHLPARPYKTLQSAKGTT